MAEQKTVQYYAVSLFTSRTFWVNFLGFLIAALSLTEVVTLIPPRFMSLYGAVMALVNIALRYMTVRPVALIAPGKTQVTEVEKIAPPKPPPITD